MTSAPSPLPASVNALAPVALPTLLHGCDNPYSSSMGILCLPTRQALLRRSLYKLALDVARAWGAQGGAGQGADAATLASIHQRWGDHLYSKVRGGGGGGADGWWWRRIIRGLKHAQVVLGRGAGAGGQGQCGGLPAGLCHWCSSFSNRTIPIGPHPTPGMTMTAPGGRTWRQCHGTTYYSLFHSTKHIEGYRDLANATIKE